MRIATWNMAYCMRKRLLNGAWDYFLNEIDADFYFFQEAMPSRTIADDAKHLVWNGIGGSRPWGSGIYSKKYELCEETIETQFKGSLTLANTAIDNEKITLVSIYGLMEKGGPANGYSITNLHRMLSDLTGLLNGHIGGKRKIVMGGDLNASVQIDWQQKNNSHRIFFDRVEDFGLGDCFKLLDKKYPQRTLRHSKSNVKWENDYFFISKTMFGKLAGCEVIENDKVIKYSDHNPVVITLKL